MFQLQNFESNISGQIFLSILVSLANFVLIYVLNIFLANHLSPEDFGDYSVAISTGNFLALVGTLGLEKLATRFLPSLLEKKDHQKSYGLIRYTFFMIVGSSVIFALAGIFVLGWQASQNYYHPLYIALWLVPFLTMTRIFSFWIRGTNHYLAAQIPNFLQEPLLTLIFVYVFFLWEKSMSDFMAIELIFISLTTVLFIQFFYLRKFLPTEIFKEEPVYEAKKWLSISLPMLLATLVFLAMQQIDIWILELMGRNENQVGFYAVISRTMSFLVLISTTVGTLLAPMISLLVETKESKKLQMIIIQAQRILFLMALAFTLILVFFGRKILALFGPEYASYYPALLICAVGYIFNLIFCLAFHALQNSGYEKQSLRGALVALIFHFGLALIYIPMYGLYAAVIISSVTLVGLYFWYAWLVWRKLHIRLLPI